MRVVLQRASSARVEVDGVVVGDLGGPGLVALVGVTHGDGPTQVEWMARKIAHLRIFDGPGGDESTGAERSAVEAELPVLVVSQFTLYGDVRKGRRPSFSSAAGPELAERLYEEVVARLRARGLPVATGRFRASMNVRCEVDGPVTIQVDSRRLY